MAPSRSYSGMIMQPDPSVEVPAGEQPLELSVVMPCLNEVKTLGICIEKARDCMARDGIVGEIVIADNGSTDGSQALAESLGARVVHVEEKGYGAALHGGISAARGRFVIMGDSDDSYDFSVLLPLVEQLRAGHDLVMGNRFAGGIEDGAMPLLHRYFGNPFLSAVGRLFFRSPCGDFYCGQRGFTKEAFDRLQLRSKGMEFALEMLVKATMTGMRITEVPVTLSPDGRGRPPHLRRWRDGWRSLRFYLLYSPRWLFLYPGIALFLLGAAALAWLLPGGREVMGVRLDVHTLVYAAISASAGVQLVLFSVLAKACAMATGLHPRSSRLEAFVMRIRLERGLLLGAGLFLAGLLVSILTTLRWAEGSFGDLDPFQTMRVVIPAALLMGLGLQTMVGSFMLALMQLPLASRIQGASSDGQPARG